MRNKIPYIIAASTIALLSLIAIQVQWMLQSKQLIENQFDQKVRMALCQVADQLTGCSATCTVVGKAAAPEPGCKPAGFTVAGLTEAEVHSKISTALTNYDIDLPFELEIDEKGTAFLSLIQAEDRVYSCALNPVQPSEEQEMSIHFPNKQAYIFGQLGFMLALSVLILLLITGVFVYANYYLLRQKQISERNKEFFNHMAHEFKTPLTNIGLAARLLGKKREDSLLDIISLESQQLDERVNRVLTMAGLESGRYDINCESIHLAEWLPQLIKTMDIQFKTKGAEVSLDIPTGLVIWADPFHFGNALRNVLENSLKYCSETPRIQILATAEAEKIRIRIQDNGIGIAPDQQQLIFDKFYRTPKGVTPVGKGFGLGLSYVKKVLELHHGAVEIVSDGAHGTHFDLLLPESTATYASY